MTGFSFSSSERPDHPALHCVIADGDRSYPLLFEHRIDQI
jgi:hypothetical protein